ncbi:hypothetical protein BDQ17DRAFT_1431193 [Cyathus striatus]|nr:hypothetical protein BDQ17DRAFT_1431193 [Cyathus striatus]
MNSESMHMSQAPLNDYVQTQIDLEHEKSQIPKPKPNYRARIVVAILFYIVSVVIGTLACALEIIQNALQDSEQIMTAGTAATIGAIGGSIMCGTTVAPVGSAIILLGASEDLKKIFAFTFCVFYPIPGGQLEPRFLTR